MFCKLNGEQNYRSRLRLKGESRHKAQYYDERFFFFIRHFSNCFTLHRNALAAWAACLDLRLDFAPCRLVWSVVTNKLFYTNWNVSYFVHKGWKESIFIVVGISPRIYLILFKNMTTFFVTNNIIDFFSCLFFNKYIFIFHE